MVKLRSGKIYIDQNLFNNKINEMNYLIKNKYLSTYRNELENFYLEIKELDEGIQIKKGKRDSKYFEYNGKKIYLNELNKTYLNNNNFRLNLYENIWIKISEFLIYYKNLKKKNILKMVI